MNSSTSVFLVLVLFVAGAGSYIGSKFASDGTPSPLPLHAMTAAESNDSFSVSTGLINSDAGGFYSLNHDTGELRCKMIDLRTNKIIGTFRADVTKDMQFNKTGERKYLMRVSYFVPDKTKNAINRLGASACFVTETVTGRVIAYRVAYDKLRQVAGNNQSGTLEPGPSFLLYSTKTSEKK